MLMLQLPLLLLLLLLLLFFLLLLHLLLLRLLLLLLLLQVLQRKLENLVMVLQCITEQRLLGRLKLICGVQSVLVASEAPVSCFFSF